MKKPKPPKRARGNLHDNLFCSALSDIRIVKDFVRQFLPLPLVEAMNLEHLEICKDKMVSAALDSRITDMLFRVKLKESEEDAYIAVLLEHHSKPYKHLALRVLQYECSIMAQHLKTYGKIPLVYSLVYYNGQKPWNYPTDIRAEIDAPAELVEQYALKPFQLVDLSKISDEQLKQHLWSGLMSTVMKHIFDQDILPALKAASECFKQIDQHEGHEFAQNLVYYIYKKASIQDESSFRSFISEQFPEESGADFMATLAQIHTEKGRREGRQEGWQEGRQEGRQEGEQLGTQKGQAELLIRQLSRRFGELSPTYRQRIQAADAQTLLVWGERLLDATRLSDVFEQ